MSSREHYSDLTLGTAQLGLEYGIANVTGKPKRPEAIALVRQAVADGVTSIDTARAYGDAESRIGEALADGIIDSVQVITKLDPLDDLGPDESEENVRLAVETSILRSCQALRTQYLSTLLLHRWKHRTMYNEVIWRKLLELKEEGIIKQLGASVCNPEEAIKAIADPDLEHIQVPFNVLDRRWKISQFPQMASQKNGVVVHARSVLLQGVLSADASVWYKVAGNQGITWSRKLDRLVKEFGRESRADLCFAYVRAQTWIDSVVVGVETLSQLQENLKLFQKLPLTDDECQRVESELAGAPEDVLNPAKWIKK